MKETLYRILKGACPRDSRMRAGWASSLGWLLTRVSMLTLIIWCNTSAPFSHQIFLLPDHATPPLFRCQVATLTPRPLVGRVAPCTSAHRPYLPCVLYCVCLHMSLCRAVFPIKKTTTKNSTSNPELLYSRPSLIRHFIIQHPR